MNPGANFETSVVGPLEILVALVKRQIGQGSSNSGRFSGRPSMSPFLAICFSPVIKTLPKRWWISWERVFFWKSTESWDNKILVSVRIDLDNLEVKIVKIVASLVGWSPRTTLRVKKVTMFKRFKCNFPKTNIKLEGTWWYSVGRMTWTIINWYNWIYKWLFRKAT